jgi:hypothetical protein
MGARRIPVRDSRSALRFTCVRVRHTEPPDCRWPGQIMSSITKIANPPAPFRIKSASSSGRRVESATTILVADTHHRICCAASLSLAQEERIEVLQQKKGQASIDRALTEKSSFCSTPGVTTASTHSVRSSSCLPVGASWCCWRPSRRWPAARTSAAPRGSFRPAPSV